MTRARECVSVLVSFREATLRATRQASTRRAPTRDFSLDVTSIFGHIFSHKKSKICEMALCDWRMRPVVHRKNNNSRADRAATGPRCSVRFITQYTMAAIASIPTVRATAAPKVAVRRTSVRAAASGLRTQFGSSTKAFAPLGYVSRRPNNHGEAREPRVVAFPMRARARRGDARATRADDRNARGGEHRGDMWTTRLAIDARLRSGRAVDRAPIPSRLAERDQLGLPDCLSCG